jgi:RND family efflux transporter MFP subunit
MNQSDLKNLPVALQGSFSANRRRLAIGFIAAMTVASAALLLQGHPRAAAPTAVTPALTVTVAAGHHADWSVILEASGAIAAWQEASIGGQIGGYQLTDVRVNVGDQVKKGQILARLNRELLLADEAQLKANDEQADANRDRILTLQSSGAVSEQDTLQFVTQAKVADALLASKRLQLRYTDIIAPDDGAISSRTATLGAVVPVGQELFRLIRQNRLEWRGELTAEQLARVKPGQTITLALPDGRSVTAAVRQLAPSLDSQSRLGLVYADIVPGSSARAGMYANGRIELNRSGAFVVPAACVVIRDGRTYVLVVADHASVSKVALRAVTTGRRQDQEIEVLSGIANNETLIVEGASFLGDGDTVRVAESDSTRAAPTTAKSTATP